MLTIMRSSLSVINVTMRPPIANLCIIRIHTCHWVTKQHLPMKHYHRNIKNSNVTNVGFLLNSGGPWVIILGRDIDWIGTSLWLHTNDTISTCLHSPILCYTHFTYDSSENSSTNGETTNLTTITYRYSCHLCVSYRCHIGSYRCHICSKSCTAKDGFCINSDDDVHDDSDFGDDSDEDCHDNSDLGDNSDDYGHYDGDFLDNDEDGHDDSDFGDNSDEDGHDNCDFGDYIVMMMTMTTGRRRKSYGYSSI